MEPGPMVRSVVQLWNMWEIQLSVLFSFTLQVFLLLTGNFRRRHINGVLRILIWLAYVGADSVTVFGLGLFANDKEKLGTRSFEDTLPFLWVPFLIVHLGGQDSITAFSIEDNNLWLRHLLNLGVQVFLSLYIFWRSMHNIHNEVLVPAAFVFVSGIIKYVERIWALKSGSRNGLGKRISILEQSSENRSSMSMYALQTVLSARGLVKGCTVYELGDGIKKQLVEFRQEYNSTEDKKRIVMTELRMLFDLLYTKAILLQTRWGLIFRGVAQVTMVSAFVLFLASERHHTPQKHNRINVIITYILFVGAIIMEAFSVVVEIVSPWTKARLRQGTLLHKLLGSNACSRFMSVQCNMMDWLAPYSIGQYNYVDYIRIPKSKVMFKVLNALGLAKLWINARYVKHVDAQEILDDIVEWFDRHPRSLFEERDGFKRKLNYTLCLPFRHLRYRLHLFTDLHICKHFDQSDTSRYSAKLIRLKEVCEKLSNYMFYLDDSMLPMDGAPEMEATWTPGDNRSKLEIVDKHVREFVNKEEPNSESPFECGADAEDLTQSMEDIKELWIRLLVYSAGKCRAEVHARQLANGGELISFVWLLMLHHGLGDAATEVKLLKSFDNSLPKPGSVVSVAGSSFRPRPEEPHYAFTFRRQQDWSPASPRAEYSHTHEALSILNFLGSVAGLS